MNVDVRAYRHSAGGVGTTDSDTGEYTPPAAPTDPFWEGSGIFLDEGPAERFSPSGAVLYEADAKLYLPRDTVGEVGFAERDVLVITYENGDVVDAEVARAIRFKDCLHLRRA